jgi:L-iditol 2-dehydrogenase
MKSAEAARHKRALLAPSDRGKARQAVLYAPGRLELRDFSPPRPGPGELLVKIECALSCGTDLKTYRRGHPLFPMPTPLGHEFSGVIVELGEGVERFEAGDAVMAVPSAPCGRCFLCRRGQENLCAQVAERIVAGAYADYLLLPAHVVGRHTFKKPDHISFETAALLEPLSCVFHALELAHTRSCEAALIVGAGPFGLLHLIVLKARGVRQVVVAGRRSNRLQCARELGADQVVDVEREELAAVAARLNGGWGPDLVIEATGLVAGWEQALRWVRRGGRVIFFGGCQPGTVVPLDTRRMHYDNLTLVAPFHFRPRDVLAALQALSGQGLPGLERIIDARRRLDQLPEVFMLLEQGAALKCAIIP